MLPRAQRLTRGDDVRAVLRRGRRRAGELVVVHVRERGDSDPARLTAVASRKVGGAVERNRAKRVLRAAVVAVELHPGVDVALVARPATTACSTAEVVAEIEQMFPSGIGPRTGARA